MQAYYKKKIADKIRHATSDEKQMKIEHLSALFSIRQSIVNFEKVLKSRI